MYSQSDWLSFHPTPPTAPTPTNKRTQKKQPGSTVSLKCRLLMFGPPVTGVALCQAASSDVEVPEGSKPVDESGTNDSHPIQCSHLGESNLIILVVVFKPGSLEWLGNSNLTG